MNPRRAFVPLVLALVAGCTQVDPEVIDKLSQRTHWLKDKIDLLQEQVEQHKHGLERLQTRYIDLDTRHKRLDLEFKLIQNRVKPLREAGEKAKAEERLVTLMTQLPTASPEEWKTVKKDLVKFGSLAVPFLLQAYKNGQISRASEVLLEIKDESALPALVAALEVSMTRLVAIEALGRLGMADAIEYIVPYLGDDDPAVKLQVATALGALGDMSGIPVLIAELDHHEHTRRMLANSLLEGFTKTTVGYRAEFNKEKRQPYIAKWKSWWRQNKDRFKLAWDAYRKNRPVKPGGEKPGKKPEEKPGETPGGEGAGGKPGGGGKPGEGGGS